VRAYGSTYTSSPGANLQQIPRFTTFCALQEKLRFTFTTINPCIRWQCSAGPGLWGTSTAVCRCSCSCLASNPRRFSAVLCRALKRQAYEGTNQCLGGTTGEQLRTGERLAQDLSGHLCLEQPYVSSAVEIGHMSYANTKRRQPHA
jgi:hypothetical protein